MDVLGDLVARDRRRGGAALRDDAADRAVSYRDFCTTAHKAGNLLRSLGVRHGDRVVVDPTPAPVPVVALLGGSLLGAVTRFGRDVGAGAVAAVVPVGREAAVDPPAGCSLAAYGGPPEGAATAHWESVLWGENPAAPPTAVSPGDPALAAGGRTHDSRTLLSAARGVVAAASIDRGTAVALRGSLTDPRAVVAGVLAPLVAGGTVVLPAEGTVADVAAGPGPEPRSAALGEVEL